MTFISVAFPSPTSKTTLVSHRLGFGESSPQVMGVVSSSPFPLEAPPFVLLFSPSALAHPIQTAFAGPILQFLFAVPPSVSFAGQAIDNLDEFQQQVAYDRTAHLGKMGKRKEMEGAH